MLERHTIIEKLVENLEPVDGVLAMWEAGSAAFGRIDEYSDLDLVLDVTAEAIPEAVERFERTLADLSPIIDDYELPPPTWHGHVQHFYRLRDTSPFLMIDVVFIEHENPQKFLEAELHGRPVVYFDKANVVQSPPFDWDGHQDRMRHQITNSIAMMKMISNLPAKEVLRGRPLDALSFYNGLICRPLITLLRAKHDPARFTFGNRYLIHDLPKEDYSRLEPLLFVAGPADLRRKIPQALAWFWELAAEFEAQ